MDECIDWRLAKELVGHDIKTVPDMGWAGVENGALLSLAEAVFDVFVTVESEPFLPTASTKVRYRGFGITRIIKPFGGFKTPRSKNTHGNSDPDKR